MVSQKIVIETLLITSVFAFAIVLAARTPDSDPDCNAEPEVDGHLDEQYIQARARARAQTEMPTRHARRRSGLLWSEEELNRFKNKK